MDFLLYNFFLHNLICSNAYHALQNVMSVLIFNVQLYPSFENFILSRLPFRPIIALLTFPLPLL